MRNSSIATICQLVHGLSVGGAEILAAGLARHFRDAFRFLFVCLDELGPLGQQLRAEGFPVWLLRRQPGVDWRCSWRLARLLRRERVDLLHVHQYTPFFYAMTARVLCRRPPVLFTEHGRWYPDYPRRKRIVANRLLLERRDRVVGVGQAVRQALIHNEGFASDRVQVIYNGIDMGSFVCGGAPSATVRSELGVGAGQLLLLQVARLDPLKDHATAIRTLGHVVRQGVNAHLVLVGEGPERSRIQEVVQQQQLEERVRFLGLRRDIPRLLSAADLFLLTSVSEGIPLTLIEALAVGLPVVATRVGGVQEVIEDGKTGLLAPRGDDVALAKHVLRLAGDPALSRQMAELGPERARALFSDCQMHDRYSRLYREMLQGVTSDE
jgi:glycosyltransferase involved in cell wall biosynthesis